MCVILLAGANVTSQLFEKSIELLYQANFMSDHKLTSVQAICVLLQVAHNLDKSDLICILISSAIRISQCIGLHRLGSDASALGTGSSSSQSLSKADVVSREVGKRIWWFLVRYDWFQIPFQNVCQIHPAHFNTPMPSDCFEELERMVVDGAVASQPDQVPTATSWVTMLNQSE